MSQEARTKYLTLLGVDWDLEKPCSSPSRHPFLKTPAPILGPTTCQVRRGTTPVSLTATPWWHSTDRTHRAREADNRQVHACLGASCSLLSVAARHLPMPLRASVPLRATSTGGVGMPGGLKRIKEVLQEPLDVFLSLTNIPHKAHNSKKLLQVHSCPGYKDCKALHLSLAKSPW